MNQLLYIKKKVYAFIGRFEIYVVAALRFVIALLVFRLINDCTGYMSLLSDYPIALIFALICSFLPSGMMIFLAAVLVLLQFYAASPMLCLIIGLLFVILFCVYFRFSDRKGIYVLLTPALSALGIPYVMPVAGGIFGEAYTVVSVVCGEAVYFIMKHGIAAVPLFAVGTSDDGGIAAITGVITQVISEMVTDMEMYLYMAAFALGGIVTCCIRKLSAKYAQFIAVAVGIFAQMAVVGAGEVKLLGNEINGSFLIPACFICLAIMAVVIFAVRDLDYQRRERVQFEDDEYYYYVTAVPKAFAFAEKRRSAPRRVAVPHGESELQSEASEIEEKALARMTRDEMRQDVPGTEGE